MQLAGQRDEPLLGHLCAESFVVERGVQGAPPRLDGDHDPGERDPRQHVLPQGLRQIRAESGSQRCTVIHREELGEAGDRDERRYDEDRHPDGACAALSLEIDATGAPEEEGKRDHCGVPHHGADAEHVEQRAEVRRRSGKARQ